MHLVSSCFFQEIAQSILQDETVIDLYHKKINTISEIPYISKNIKIGLKINRQIFKSYLLYKQNKSNELHIWSQVEEFYLKNYERIEYFREKLFVIDEIIELRQQFADLEIKNFNSDEVENKFSLYFSNSDVKAALEQYFKNLSFNAIKEKMINDTISLEEIAIPAKLIIAEEINKNKIIDKISSEDLTISNIKFFFEKSFCKICYVNFLSLELFSDKIKLEKFIDVFRKKRYQELLPFYIEYKDDLVSILNDDLLCIKNYNRRKTRKDIAHCNDSKEFTAVEYLITKLFLDYLTIKYISKINNATLQLRPNHMFTNGPIGLFSDIKLDNKILRWVIQECVTTKKEKTIFHNSRIGKQLSNDIYEYEISEQTSIYKTGSRVDFVNFSIDGSSYEKISKELISFNLPGRQISWQLKGIIKYGESSISNKRNRRILYELTHLLFRTETERNVSALITNAMFFELLEVDAVGLNDLSERLPIALKSDQLNKHGAVSASRWLVNYLWGNNGEQRPYLSKKHTYDLEMVMKLQLFS